MAGPPARTFAAVEQRPSRFAAGSWQYRVQSGFTAALAWLGRVARNTKLKELTLLTLPYQVAAEALEAQLAVIAALDEALGASATLLSWWEGPQLTVLFYYGRDPGRMHAVLSSAANLSPLSQGSTVTSIT